MFMTKKFKDKIDSPDLCNVTLDEMAECSIYDAPTLQERIDLTKKKVRKVYKDQPVIVTLRMRNPLLNEISLSNVKLACRFKDSDD